MNTSRDYLRSIYRRFNLFGAWPPNQRVEVGEVGVIEDGAFRRVTTLYHFGLTFEVLSSGQTGDLDYSEGASVSVGTDLSAEIAPLPSGVRPSAGLHVKLSRSGSFLFQATGVTEWRIADVVGIEAAVLAAADAKTWDPSWVIVHRVLQTDGVTVLLGQSAGAEVKLAARGTLKAGPINLASADLGLSVVEATGESLRFVSERGLTPLYQALRLNHRLFQRDRLEAAPLSFSLEEPGLELAQWEETPETDRR